MQAQLKQARPTKKVAGADRRVPGQEAGWTPTCEPEVDLLLRSEGRQEAKQLAPEFWPKSILNSWLEQGQPEWEGREVSFFVLWRARAR